MKTIKAIAISSLGACSFALAVVFFYDPFKIAPGGLTGFAVIISNIFPFLSTGTIVFIMNIPLLILAWIKFGKKFVALTIYATLLSSILMNAIPTIDIGTNDLIIPALCGALLDAIGVGLVYRAGGCTGGTDIIVKSLRQKYRHIRTGAMYLVVNTVVLISTFIAFGDFEIVVYSAIAMTVASFTLDKVLYGGEGAKLIFIISDKYEKITAALLTSVEVGVTLLSGEGAYSRKEKKIILCAVKPMNFPKIRDTVKECDPNAFLIISSATEIFGEGYKSHYTEEI
ncbi:MAG: YitT family protein [Clostridia bacterium]|nr:YitT family protein [Clostridia bacterium]